MRKCVAEQGSHRIGLRNEAAGGRHAEPRSVLHRFLPLISTGSKEALVCASTERICIMTVAADSIFLDTNILVYASADTSPLHAAALNALTALETSGVQLWISRQVMRKYLATLVRPKSGTSSAQTTEQTCGEFTSANTQARAGHAPVQICWPRPTLSCRRRPYSRALLCPPPSPRGKTVPYAHA